MNFYVLAKRDSDDLDTPVFDMGTSSNESAVAIFLRRQAAVDYLTEANWSSDHTVAAIEPTQTLKWLVHAQENGIDFVAIDPDRQKQVAGRDQPGLYLDDPLRVHADLLHQLQEVTESQ